MTTLFLLASTVLAVYLQVSLPFAYLPVDFVFLTCVFTGLQRGQGAGLAVGAFGGLLLDTLVSPTLGPRMISMAVTGALADSFSNLLNREQPRLQMAATAMLSVVHDGLLYGVGALLHLNQEGLHRLVFDYVLPRLLVHAILAVPVFYVFRALVRARVFKDPLSQPPGVIRKLPR